MSTMVTGHTLCKGCGLDVAPHLRCSYYQSSFVLVEQMALLCGTTQRKALLYNHDNFSKLLSTFVDSRVTSLVLATCHA